jgi:hypothetical protein
MDILLALILSCSVHFDDHMVEALAMKLSISNQYFVGDLSTLDTYDNAHSVGEAHKVVDAIIAKGGRPAVGYLAVPIAWAARFGRTTDDLFDGCVNIGIATAMLSEYNDTCSFRPDYRHRSKRQRGRRSHPTASHALRYCILRRLEIDLDITGVPEHVLPEIAKLDAKPQDPDVDPPPARSPPFPDDTDTSRIHETTDWSSPRLYASSPPAPPVASTPAAPATDARPSLRSSTPAGSAPSLSVKRP